MVLNWMAILQRQMAVLCSNLNAFRRKTSLIGCYLKQWLALGVSVYVCSFHFRSIWGPVMRSESDNNNVRLCLFTNASCHDDKIVFVYWRRRWRWFFSSTIKCSRTKNLLPVSSNVNYIPNGSVKILRLNATGAFGWERELLFFVKL